MGHSIDAIIFDKDGIILDTEGQKFRAWEAALQARGVRLTVEEYVRDFVGNSGKENIKKLNKSRGLSLTNLVVDEKNKILKTLQSEGVSLMPYAQEAVEVAYDCRLPLAVASSDSHEATIEQITNAKLSDFFKVIRGTDKAKGEPEKPHPFIYLDAARRLGTPAVNCASFEDTTAGIISAKDAGTICVAVKNSYSLLQDFSRADAIMPNLLVAVNRVLTDYAGFQLPAVQMLR